MDNQEENILSCDTDNLPDLKLVAEGPVELSIITVEMKRSEKSNRRYLAIRFEVPSDELALDIYHNISWPEDAETEKNEILAKGRLRKFCDAFGIDSKSINPNEVVGLRGWANVKLIKDDYKGGDEMKNEIKSFRVER